MAARYLIAALLLLYAINHITAHYDNQVNSNPADTSALLSVEKDDGINMRKNMQEQQWQYEGLPIEIPFRRSQSGEEWTSTTTMDPPLDRRYRRIYNPDEVVSINDYPFLAALLVNKKLWCGGAIIDYDRILTAAHCLQLQYNNRFFREYVKMLSVRLGSSNSSAGGELFRVSEILFHPNYKPSTLEFNFAIIKLHKNITFDKQKVAIIEHTQTKNVATNSNITFLGWGSVLGTGGYGGQVLLQKLILPVYDLADCQDIYGRDLVTRVNFCAGFITVAKNVCNVSTCIRHDAGGPAIMNGRLVGILSFSSKRCDIPDKPAVFSSVGHIASWLEASTLNSISTLQLVE